MKLTSDPVVNDAFRVAEAAHAGETRKCGSEPYLNHVLRVTETVASLSDGNRDMVIAALMHDTVEHDALTLKSVRNMFGKRVAEMVGMLTPYYTSERFPNMSRARRKQCEAYRLGSATAQTRTIKLADRLDNIQSVQDIGEDFARVYAEETLFLLRAIFVDGWHTCPMHFAAWSRANQEAKRILG